MGILWYLILGEKIPRRNHLIAAYELNQYRTWVIQFDDRYSGGNLFSITAIEGVYLFNAYNWDNYLKLFGILNGENLRLYYKYENESRILHIAKPHGNTEDFICHLQHGNGNFSIGSEIIDSIQDYQLIE